MENTWILSYALKFIGLIWLVSNLKNIHELFVESSDSVFPDKNDDQEAGSKLFCALISLTTLLCGFGLLMRESWTMWWLWGLVVLQFVNGRRRSSQIAVTDAGGEEFDYDESSSGASNTAMLVTLVIAIAETLAQVLLQV